MTGGPYAQYGPKLRVIFPGWTGGGNWNGSAFNPDLGYLFVPTQDHGMLNKMVKSTRVENMYVRSGPDNAPPMLGTNFWDGRKGWPCQQPPWGELVAVNANTGDIAWRVPLGSFEELDALGVPATGTLNRGGPIATAGGLVFIAASQDARFRAFDARTGKVLWVADLTENGRAVPITYQGKSGKQYVAIMAGGGRPVARKVDESRIGGRLHVFALAGNEMARRPGATTSSAENDVRLTRETVACCWCCCSRRRVSLIALTIARPRASADRERTAEPASSPGQPRSCRLRRSCRLLDVPRTDRPHLQPHGHGARHFPRVSGSEIQTRGIACITKPRTGTTRWLERDGKVYQRRHQTGFDGKRNQCARARGALRRRVGQSRADVPAPHAAGRLVQLPVSWYTERGVRYAQTRQSLRRGKVIGR